MLLLLCFSLKTSCCFGIQAKKVSLPRQFRNQNEIKIVKIFQFDHPTMNNCTAFSRFMFSICDFFFIILFLELFDARPSKYFTTRRRINNQADKLKIENCSPFLFNFALSIAIDKTFVCFLFGFVLLCFVELNRNGDVFVRSLFHQNKQYCWSM